MATLFLMSPFLLLNKNEILYNNIKYLLENSLIIMYNKTKKLDGRYVI